MRYHPYAIYICLLCVSIANLKSFEEVDGQWVGWMNTWHLSCGSWHVRAKSRSTARSATNEWIRNRPENRLLTQTGHRELCPEPWQTWSHLILQTSSFCHTDLWRLRLCPAWYRVNFFSPSPHTAAWKKRKFDLASRKMKKIKDEKKLSGQVWQKSSTPRERNTDWTLKISSSSLCTTAPASSPPPVTHTIFIHEGAPHVNRIRYVSCTSLMALTRVREWTDSVIVVV